MRTLPRLLALLLVACGGRYSTTTESEGAGATGSAGTQGKTAPPGDQDPTEPGGGFTMPSIPPSQGGRSTGTGGAASAGVGMGGTGFGFAGAPIGTAGTNAGQPVTDFQLCAEYCSVFTTVCPENTSQAQCSKQCFADISNATAACAPAKRADYACITSIIAPLSSCPGALAISSKLCGSTAGVPAPCYDEPACPLEIYGDSSGCHAISDCSYGQSDLHCLETGGVPRCTCYVNGVPVAELMTGAMSTKQACTDEELRRLCMAQL
jgi:hypothetical protein